MVEGLKLLPEGEDGKFWSLNGNLRVVLIPDSCVICPACRSLKYEIIKIPRGFQNQLRVFVFFFCLFSFLVLFFPQHVLKPYKIVPSFFKYMALY